MLVYGKCECFVMQVLYVCVLCASCGSSQCCVLHEKASIVHTGVPQGSKLPPSLFSVYISDKSRATEPVKRICMWMT